MNVGLSVLLLLDCIDILSKVMGFVDPDFFLSKFKAYGCSVILSTFCFSLKASLTSGIR